MMDMWHVEIVVAGEVEMDMIVVEEEEGPEDMGYLDSAGHEVVVVAVVVENVFDVAVIVH